MLKSSMFQFMRKYYNLSSLRFAYNVNLSNLTTQRSCSSIPESKARPQESTDQIKISDNCVQRLQNISKDKQFLRVTVDGGGCSGFQYNFSMDSAINTDDRVFQRDGAQVVVDEISLDYIKGSTIDYHTELIRSAFRILDNPVAEHGCSCGASFSIKL